MSLSTARAMTARYGDVRSRLMGETPKLAQLRKTAKALKEAREAEEMRKAALDEALDNIGQAAVVSSEPPTPDPVLNTEIADEEIWRQKISMREIVAAVSEVRGVAMLDILSARQFAAFAGPRKECYWLGRNLTTRSYPEIARSLGRSDHTTVIKGMQSHQRLIDSSMVDSLGDILPVIKRRRIEKLAKECATKIGGSEAIAP